MAPEVDDQKAPPRGAQDNAGDALEKFLREISALRDPDAVSRDQDKASREVRQLDFGVGSNGGPLNFDQVKADMPGAKQAATECLNQFNKLPEADKLRLADLLGSLRTDPDSQPVRKEIEKLAPGFLDKFTKARTTALAAFDVKEPRPKFLDLPEDKPAAKDTRAKALLQPMRTIDCHRQQDPLAGKGLELDFWSKDPFGSARSALTSQEKSLGRDGKQIAASLDKIISHGDRVRAADQNKFLPKLSISGKDVPYPQAEKAMDESKVKPAKDADRFAPLEDHTPGTVKWQKEQTDLTEKFLDAIPGRKEFTARVREAYNFQTRTDMFKQNGKYYFMGNQGLENQASLYVQDNLQATPRKLFDPNTLSKDGRDIVKNIKVSDCGNYVRFNVHPGGKDQGYVDEKYVGPQDKDHVDDKGNPKDKTPPTFSSKTFVSADGKYKGQDSSGSWVSGWNDVVISHRDKLGMPRQVRFDERDTGYKLVGVDGSKFFMITDKDASTRKLIEYDAESGKTKDILPAGKDHLIDARVAGGKLVAHYMADATSKLSIFSLDGKHQHDVAVPKMGTVTHMHADSKDSELLLTYHSFTQPATLYRHDVATGKTDTIFQAKPSFDTKDLKVERVLAKSKDGTEVPMFVVSKQGTKLDGTNPTYLYGYGGFSIRYTPGFEAGMMPWLQDGGVYAVANLRGGSEFGEHWHKGGALSNKQKVFDDFIGCAEKLIDSKYTSQPKLAIGGRSNGGLLVGATLAQRPDLFKAAVPEVGVLDMLRFSDLRGSGWQSEYGSPYNPADRANFLKYSPLHNLRRGVGYPAIMTMTNANDDRVLPAHSFKFVAAAQDAQGNKNPVLLYVGSRTGHGDGLYKATSQRVEDFANKFLFLKKTLDVK